MGKKITIAIILLLLIGGGIFFYFYAFSSDKLTTKEYQEQVTTSLELVRSDYGMLSSETSASAFTEKVNNINSNLTVMQAAIPPEGLTAVDQELDAAITNMQTALTNIDYATVNGNINDIEPNFPVLQEAINQINALYDQIMIYE